MANEERKGSPIFVSTLLTESPTFLSPFYRGDSFGWWNLTK